MILAKFQVDWLPPLENGQFFRSDSPLRHYCVTRNLPIFIIFGFKNLQNSRYPRVTSTDFRIVGYRNIEVRPKTRFFTENMLSGFGWFIDGFCSSEAEKCLKMFRMDGSLIIFFDFLSFLHQSKILEKLAFGSLLLRPLVLKFNAGVIFIPQHSWLEFQLQHEPYPLIIGYWQMRFFFERLKSVIF